MAFPRLPPALRVAMFERYNAIAAKRSGLLTSMAAAPVVLASTKCGPAPRPAFRGKRPYATVNDVHAETSSLHGDFPPALFKTTKTGGDGAPMLRTFHPISSQTSGEPEKQAQSTEHLDLGGEVKSARRSTRRTMRAAAIPRAKPANASEHVIRQHKVPRRTKAPAAVTPNANERPDDGEHKLDLPTQIDYPNAPPGLFERAQVINMIHNACQKLNVSLQTEFKMAQSRARKGNAASYTCSLKVDIEDVFVGSAIGEGTDRTTARQAAWLKVVAQMHAANSLRKLFPDAIPNQPPVDKQSIGDAKDARLEIYNYAASLGLVPAFKVQVGTGRGRVSARNRHSKYTVSIELPEVAVKATGIGATAHQAEVAAASDFKNKAEEVHDTNPVTAHSSGLLSIDTASSFFDFYKATHKRVVLGLEEDQVQLSGMNRNSARLTIDGKPIGQAVVAESKREASAIAQLVAAVEVTKAMPELLVAFEEEMEKGKGQILRSFRPIDLPIGSESMWLMRNVLSEARSAGLPDNLEKLSPVGESPDARPSDRPRRRQLNEVEVEARSIRMAEEKEDYEQDPSLDALRIRKGTLPMSQYREKVSTLVSNNPYSIIVGATGSGKTTQVPQILLENAVTSGVGGACNIICTQPRRIAATSVARRVASERNERVGASVGYQVRFDKALPRAGGSITYCTTGILLEQLKFDADALFDATSHIIIDEVHERDISIDFLMVVLKKAREDRIAAGKAVPKVVLMSATLDTEMFAKYFSVPDENGETQPCPSISVPGRMFPVTERYLPGFLLEVFRKHGPGTQSLLGLDKSSYDFLKVEASFSEAQKRVKDETDAEPVIDWKRQYQTSLLSEDGATSAQEKEEALVPVALVAMTIAHICGGPTTGAILAFFPGLAEITQTHRILLENRILGIDFGNQAKYKICLLHSTIPKEQQDEIFAPSPPGCRKIILSTNIAETSVTIDGLQHVIDTGKLREKRYDYVRRITKLQCVWESQSNSKQRAGRAGRVQDGFYYGLFSKDRKNALRAVGLPELLRTDLQETCLSIKAQGFREPVGSFLAQAIEPPPPAAVQAALDNLTAIEAFTEDERLTNLGQLLSRLPVHPVLAKMIVLGVIFRCLDPVLVLGAAAEERSLFVVPHDGSMKAAANSARRTYATGEFSDHLALYEAFNKIRTLNRRYGHSTAFEQSRREFIHFGAFRSIDQTANQIIDILYESGLIPRSDESHSDSGRYGPAALNRNSDNAALVKCLLLAGLHPNLGARTSERSISLRTQAAQGVIMHPSSLNDDSKQSLQNRHPVGSMFAFSTLSKSADGTTLFMRDSTRVDPLMAALFGGKLRWIGGGQLKMDDWLPFFAKSYNQEFAAKLVLEFRKALDRTLNGAFRSLAELNKEQQASFADDPVREKFTDGVVKVLNQATGNTLPSHLVSPSWQVGRSDQGMVLVRPVLLGRQA